MIPLGGTEIPTNLDELETALRIGLRELVHIPDESSAISAAPDRLRIDLTGSTLLLDRLSQELVSVGLPVPGPRFAEFEAVGHPLLYLSSRLDFEVKATDVQFQFDRTSSGRPVMAIAAAQDGRIAVRISRTDFERLATAKAAEFAKANGITLDRIDYDIAQTAPRSLRFNVKAHVQTKALLKMIRGAIVLNGQLDIDDDLVARATGLNIAGEGKMISLAVNLYRGKLLALEGKEFPLTDWELGGVRLRDLELHVGNELAFTASFGS